MDQANAINQREALFAPARKGAATSKSGIAPNSSGTSKDDELMAATANVTDGLRRTRQLLEQELERSSLSTQVLGMPFTDLGNEEYGLWRHWPVERSSQTLTLTSDQYTSFAGLLQASKNIITTMQKADTLDRLLILAALLFFGLVCLLIIKRRILDRGIRAATLVSRLAGGGSAAHISKNIKSSLASGLTSVAATGTSIAASVAMSSYSTTPASKVQEASISPASAVASAPSTLSIDPALVTTIPLSLVNMEGSTSYAASETTSAAAAPTEVALTQDIFVDEVEDVALDSDPLGVDLGDDVDLAELDEEVPLDYHQDEDADTEESPRLHIADEL
jgi:protein transport protein SEC20